MRRLLAAAAIALLLTPNVSALAQGERPHACTDHVCHCRAAARPQSAPPEAPACHGRAEARARSLVLQSTCDHDRDAGALSGLAPATLPLASSLQPDLVASTLQAAHGAPTGLRPVPEPQPPRPHAS